MRIILQHIRIHTVLKRLMAWRMALIVASLDKLLARGYFAAFESMPP